MEKNIYDEKVYLSGDEEAISHFIDRREHVGLCNTIERIAYRDIIKDYNTFMVWLCVFLKELPFNNSLEYCTILSYMIKNGYLSADKNFKDEEIKSEIISRPGTSIIRGYGCCRNYSDMAQDALTLLDFYAKKLYCYHPLVLSSKPSRKKEANHVINIVSYEDVKYGIDLLNNCFLFKFKNPLVLERISSRYKLAIRNKPYLEIIQGSSLDEVLKELKEYDLESKKEFIASREYEREIRERTLSYLKSHKDMLEDFHNSSNELKTDLSLRLSKIKY